MEPQLPLPNYPFDATISDDENFLTWAVILARHSFSKKGHMAALLVSSSSSSCSTDPISRVLAYANNTPLLYHSNPKNVSEIHAEALCVSLSASRGVSVQGATCYVTFPPCNECFKLLVASGIKRIVFRKGILPGSGDSLLISAQTLGIKLVGTTFKFARNPIDLVDQPSSQIRDSEKKLETIQTTKQEIDLLLQVPADQISLSQMQIIETYYRIKDRNDDRQREDRAKAFWQDVNETSQITRDRVDTWWTSWYQRYKLAAKQLREQRRGGFGVQDKMVDRLVARKAKRELLASQPDSSQ